MTALNSAAPVVPGSADGSVRSLAKTAAQSKLTAGIIYDELVRAARAGEPCPSNTELSRLVGASSVATPAHSIGRMAKAGRLRVTHASNGREIHIIELDITIVSKMRTKMCIRDQQAERARRAASRVPPPPPPVFRDPCFRCGVRADVGCEHAPEWARPAATGML
jgi:hypothetical protein